MTSKVQPSNWQPGDLSGLKGFDGLYSEEVRLTIEEAIPFNTDTETKHALISDAIWIAAELYAARKHAGRATPPEKKAGLSDIQHKAGKLKEALASLDYDSRIRLHEQAEADHKAQQESAKKAKKAKKAASAVQDAPGEPGGEVAADPDSDLQIWQGGDIAIAETSRQIEKLQEWSQQALDSIEQTRRGRQSDYAVKTAMKSLAALLEKASGKAPSGYSVINFATAVLSPVVGEEIAFDWYWRTRNAV